MTVTDIWAEAREGPVSWFDSKWPVQLQTMVRNIKFDM